MFPMCCSTLLRMLLPAAHLAKIPCMLDPLHTCVLCCRTWNSVQYTKSCYRTTCGQLKALYPARACVVCYLCCPCAAVVFRGSSCLPLNSRTHHACLILHTRALCAAVHGTACTTRNHPTGLHADKLRHCILTVHAWPATYVPHVLQYYFEDVAACSSTSEDTMHA